MGRLKRTGRLIRRRKSLTSALTSPSTNLISKCIVQLTVCLCLLTLPPLGLSHVAQAATSGSAGFQPSSTIWKVYKEGASMATAFAIGANRFITNAHVIKTFAYSGSGKIRLVQKGSDVKLTWSRLLAVSMTYDLALFKTKESVRDYLTIAKSFSWEQESDLYAIGYPKGSYKRVDQIGKIYYNDGMSYAIPMSKLVDSGFSGSPLMREGEVVAVLEMANVNIGYAVTLENLKGFLGGELGQPRLGVSCSQLSMRSCIDMGIEETKRLAHQEGHKVAQYQWGSAKRYIHKNYSVRLLEMSARQGFPRAIVDLGFIYYDHSEGKKADTANELLEIGAAWHQRAADEGEPEAQAELYFLYFHGEGVPQDRSLALITLTRAASAGYAPAESNLGIVYRDGIGVPADRKRGLFWLQRAADKEYEDAQAALGLVPKK